MQGHLLTWVTFIPVIGTLAILFVPKDQKDVVKVVAAVATGIQLWIALMILFAFDSSQSGMQFVEQYDWIETFNIQYFMGIDGLSMPLVLLTALLSFIGVFASWNINKASKGYFALFLLLDAGMMGVFVSLDFFLFYIFWEVMLLPMYFLIGMWGGPQREYAAIKFFLYTFAGSILMLLAMLALYFTQDPHTFNMLTLMGGTYGHTFQIVVFLALFVAFAIKVPVFPFHTWLPLAHVEAPTAISVILAGVLLKMGTYGLLRISFPILPEGTLWFALPMAILGVINIIYGAMCAMAQKDIKRLVAYSSISHMGIVLLGMAAMTKAGMSGAIFQMFNHGTITAMLFLSVGVIYDRAHHREIDGFGGLASKMPVYTGIAGVAFFAGLGLPGLSGFISEAMVFIGAFPVYTTLTIIATIGIVLNAGYFLWAFQRIFFGELNEKYKDIAVINGRELFTLVPLVVIVIFLGVYPMPMLDLFTATVDKLLDVLNFGASMAIN
ncbi:MAG: NADH-quinone oxidoreductase subunit M [Candidatus Marinimicrobia bacterium]|nr:NADH-quinone oxidoreductase subunit M [Candidatus Neomarinimicrobiota bacterium]MCF7829008.1 NADH-quinone oxidoreductase subunit M [Candidatus Neomarinimicrobiota bacterium]MCF7879968.1 NADH-quinone oxidoreductase subunit M [Candidatus Neomarinimicrobiota bacterium]